jgi:hypothetical protein
MGVIVEVRFRKEVVAELSVLPPREVDAIRNAVRKLESAADNLGFPHSSAVKNAPAPLRELRPRRGSSPWRAFYRRIGDIAVVAGIGPEAQVDPRGFARAVAAAVERLADEEAGSHG